VQDAEGAQRYAFSNALKPCRARITSLAMLPIYRRYRAVDPFEDLGTLAVSFESFECLRSSFRQWLALGRTHSQGSSCQGRGPSLVPYMRGFKMQIHTTIPSYRAILRNHTERAREPMKESIRAHVLLGECGYCRKCMYARQLNTGPDASKMQGQNTGWGTGPPVGPVTSGALGSTLLNR